MAQFTTRLGLQKPGGGSTGLILPPEAADVDVLNANFDKIDDAIGGKVVTSSSRPATPYDGQIIYETDTGRTAIWLAGSQEWKTIAEVSDTGWMSNAVEKKGDWELVESRLRVINSVFGYVYVRIKREKSTISLPSDGNIVNSECALITDEKYRPKGSGSQGLHSTHTGPVAAGNIGQDGILQLTATVNGAKTTGTIAVGKEFTLVGFYFI